MPLTGLASPMSEAAQPPAPACWLRTHLAGLAGGQSPWAAFQAWEDWALHLAASPGRQADLWQRAAAAMLALGCQSTSGAAQSDWAFRPDPADRRFRHPGWTRSPFSFFAQAQLAAEAQWRAAAEGIAGPRARRAAFLGRFALNAFAPVNFPWSNPAVIDAAWRSGGMNFLAGAALLAEDMLRHARGAKPKGMDAFRVGETVAVTPGQVVFRNALMELIQYAPATRRVRREPILVVPPWIMKYYVLDLTPPNSLVRHLVAQGFTVFIISWKNPGEELRATRFEDYRREGVMQALAAVGGIVPGRKVHAVGYCLGGTVLSIAAAAMDRDGAQRLASASLFAAQTDFGDPGELTLFVDESQLALLEDMMRLHGYLDASPMANAFYALRANELVFAKFVERYLLGHAAPPSDLDAWLTDPTRLPARMHGDYLRQLVLENRFARGSYQADGRSVALRDLRTPVFALGAERDHIAPWRSVYSVARGASADTTFVLTGGGHTGGVVSPPGKPGAYHRLRHSAAGGEHVDPDLWRAATPQQEGSWWPEWVRWLDRHSSPGRVAPPPMGGAGQGLPPLAPAPGSYVLEP